MARDTLPPIRSYPLSCSPEHVQPSARSLGAGFVWSEHPAADSHLNLLSPPISKYPKIGVDLDCDQDPATGMVIGKDHGVPRRASPAASYITPSPSPYTISRTHVPQQPGHQNRDIIPSRYSGAVLKRRSPTCTSFASSSSLTGVSAATSAGIAAIDHPAWDVYYSCRYPATCAQASSGAPRSELSVLSSN